MNSPQHVDEISKESQRVRSMINAIKKNLGIGYSEWHDEVVKAIEHLKYSHFSPCPKGQWYRLVNGETGGSRSLEWWKKLGLVVEHIGKGQPVNPKEPIPFVHTNVVDNRETVRYSVSKLQETILPLLFKYAYSLRHNINWNHHLNWNQCLEAFESNSIDVAIHNFPTILAYAKKKKYPSSLFFFPFLSFNGYALIAKDNLIKDFLNEKENSFSNLSNNRKREFFESSQILLERNTDLEWVYKKFCERFRCDWNKVKENILDVDINTAKSKFREKSTSTLYLTNHFHSTDLRKSDQVFEIIAKNEELTLHHNYSGLVCTMNYFHQHTNTVKDLIEIWFNNIEHFKKEWHFIAENDDPILNFQIDALLEVLNTYTDSHLKLSELVDSYRKSDEFFSSPLSAIDSFFKHVLNKSEEMKNNLEISLIQSKEDVIEYSDELIDKVRKQMEDIRKQLNFQY